MASTCRDKRHPLIGRLGEWFSPLLDQVDRAGGCGEGAVDQGLRVLKADLMIGELILVEDFDLSVDPQHHIEVQVDLGEAVAVPLTRGSNIHIDNP